MSKLVQFVRAAGLLGWCSLGGALIFLAMAAVEHFKDKYIAADIFVFLAALTFCLGAFNAWSEENKKVGSLERKIVDGRPRLTLEALPVQGNEEWRRQNYVFQVQNVGERAAREITFEPIKSFSKSWELRLNVRSSLIPNSPSALGFGIFCDGTAMPADGLLYYLRIFFGDGEMDRNGSFTSQINASLYDLNDEKYSEAWTMECKMPEMAIKITPVIG